MGITLPWLLFATIAQALAPSCKDDNKNMAKESLSSLSINWFAPFLSGGGYSSEATAFATALLADGRVDSKFKITLHGDTPSIEFESGLPRQVSEMMRRLAQAPDPDPERTVAICHSEPGAWNLPAKYETVRCPPDEEVLYTIGRTMFETDRIPSDWAWRCNQLDEVSLLPVALL